MDKIISGCAAQDLSLAKREATTARKYLIDVAFFVHGLTLFICYTLLQRYKVLANPATRKGVLPWEGIHVLHDVLT